MFKFITTTYNKTINNNVPIKRSTCLLKKFMDCTKPFLQTQKDVFVKDLVKGLKTRRKGKII